MRKQFSYSVLPEVSLKLLVHKLIDGAWWEKFPSGSAHEWDMPFSLMTNNSDEKIQEDVGQF